MSAHLLRIQVLALCIILSAGWDYEIQRLEEGLDNDPLWDISKLKVIRVRKGSYGLDGPAVLKVALDDNYTFEVKVLYSPTGGSYFQQTPFRLAPKTFCDFLNTHYKIMFMEKLASVSDFPSIGDGEAYCPLPAQTYNINKYEFDKDTVPEMNKGFYKLLVLFNSTTDDRRSQWDIFAKVVDY